MVFLGFFCFLWCVSAICSFHTISDDKSEVLFHGILHGSHFDDVIYLVDGTARRAAVIIFYSSETFEKAFHLGMFSSDELPPEDQLALMIYNPNDPDIDADLWFEHDAGVFDLHKRFKVTSFPSAVYIPKGTKNGDLNNVMRWETDNIYGFTTWIWKVMTFSIILTNDLDSPVYLELTKHGSEAPNMDSFKLLAGQSVVKWVTPSAIARAFIGETVDKTFVDGWIILDQSKSITIRSHSKFYDRQIRWEVFRKVHLREWLEKAKNIRWSHSVRHDNIIGQPRLISNLTTAGLSKLKIPPEVHDKLLSIYNSRKDKRDKEYYSYDFTFWNLDEVNITQVTLNAIEVDFIASHLLPIAEQWCNCSLSVLTGFHTPTRIREYPRDSVVRFHVDQMKSGHRVGFILQVLQEGTESEPHAWDLETVDNQGRRHVTAMEPGEMVIFESSKVIHGRPNPLKGDLYVNSFLYFDLKKGTTLSTQNAQNPTPSGGGGLVHERITDEL